MNQTQWGQGCLAVTCIFFLGAIFALLIEHLHLGWG